MHVTCLMKQMGNKKETFIDDGRTIAPMDIDGMPKRFFIKKQKKEIKQNDVTKSEKRALIFAAYKAFLPVLLCGIVGMLLAMLLIMLWLK